jgi:DNA-binding winged helix-turn-helix (wHTH) protein
VDEFRLLGPLEAVVDGTPVQLAAAKPRALLALLLLDRNQVVATERLIDELWGDEPPAQATKTLQVYVSQLRKSLGTERLRTQAPGYLLHVAPEELDLERFERLTAEARSQPPAEARDTLRQALSLWRGPPEPVAAQLEELRSAAYEDWLQASVESGDAVIPQLEELVAREPLRERRPAGRRARAVPAHARAVRLRAGHRARPGVARARAGDAASGQRPSPSAPLGQGSVLAAPSGLATHRYSTRRARGCRRRSCISRARR